MAECNLQDSDSPQNQISPLNFLKLESNCPQNGTLFLQNLQLCIQNKQLERQTEMTLIRLQHTLDLLFLRRPMITVPIPYLFG